MSDRDGTFHIYVMNGDGTGQVRLTQNPGLERSPSWSKDGTRLLFAYSADKSLVASEIYSIKADGTGMVRLTNNSVEDDAPALSPDGQYIVWSQANGSATSVVFTANSNGTNAQQLSLTSEFARTPSFDPQGRVIFVAKSRATSKRYQIFRTNRDGTEREQLTSTSSNFYVPSVSPDGQTLLYVDDVTDDFQMYTSPVAAFAPQILPMSQAGDSDPGWTPDGRIVFASNRDGNSEIYVANRSGSNLQRLTSNPATDRLPVATGPSDQ